MLPLKRTVEKHTHCRGRGSIDLSEKNAGNMGPGELQIKKMHNENKVIVYNAGQMC